MLAKKTSKNQLTLPKAVLSQVINTDYYQVDAENGRIVLTPVRLQTADAVRAKLNKLGIVESDVADAIKWSRKQERSQ